MQEEYDELLDTAIYKEVASEALYQALTGRTDDPGASRLMQELAESEARHKRWLTDLKDRGYAEDWHKDRVQDLKISDYLVGPDTIEGAGLQDTLIFAMKREQQSVEFYSRLTAAVRTTAAKRLCQRLVGEEVRHKIRLEILYDTLFLKED